MPISFFPYEEFEVTVYPSISLIPKNKWNEIECDSLQYKYLEFIEKAGPSGLNYYYGTIEKNVGEEKKVCGAFYFQLLTFSRNNIDAKNSFLFSFLLKLFLTLKKVNVLVCGNILAVNFPALWFDSNFINPERIIPLMMKVAESLRYDVFILKDLEDVFTNNLLNKFNFQSYPSDLTMTLRIDSSWKTDTDYYQALKKKYRQRAMKILQNGQALQRKELNLENILNESRTIEILFDQVSEKQVFKLGKIDSNYFIEYKKTFPEKFSMLGYYVNDMLVGFSTFIDRDQTLEMHYIGIDYSANADFDIYFNMLLDGISKAIGERKMELELGRTARETKAILGSKPIYFNDYFKIKGRVINYLVQKSLQVFNSSLGDNWIERHPFKSNISL